MIFPRYAFTLLLQILLNVHISHLICTMLVRCEGEIPHLRDSLRDRWFLLNTTERASSQSPYDPCISHESFRNCLWKSKEIRRAQATMWCWLRNILLQHMLLYIGIYRTVATLPTSCLLPSQSWLLFSALCRVFLCALLLQPLVHG